jgi:hypothetical protein
VDESKPSYDELSSLEAPPDYNAAPPSSPNHSNRAKYAVIAGVLIALFVIAGLATLVLSKKTATPATVTPPTPVVINTQTLDNGTLNKLNTITGPGPTSQQLTISPATLFKNTVEVQGDIKIDRSAAIGGSLTVNGAANFQNAVGISSNLAVRGALSVGGALSAASINVGSLAITTINVSGSLNFGGHIVPGGTAPTTQISSATSGGTVTISGNDTAGTVTINIGNGQLTPGELAIITFKTAFTGTPKVQLTPINSAASDLRYYATRSASFFTVDTASPTTAGASYVFDYLVTQ